MARVPRGFSGCPLLERSWRVSVSPDVLEELTEYARATSMGDGEHCGGLRIEYNPVAGYLVSGVVRGEYERSGGSCVPDTGGLQGVWHTHPRGLCGASHVDRSTMLDDAGRSVEGVWPGVPPLNLVAAMGGSGLCISGYAPSYSLSCRVVEWVGAWETLGLEGLGGEESWWHGFHWAEAGWVVEPLTGSRVLGVRVSGEAGDEGGVYVGHGVPVHAVPVLLEFARRRLGRRFLVVDEVAGVYRVEVSSGRPVVEEVDVSEGSPGYGRGERMGLLGSRHGFPVERIRGLTVALFGLGFIGGRIAGVLAPYVGRLLLVDSDVVGEENVGYQDGYRFSDIGRPKTVAMAKMLLERHVGLRVVPVVARVPDGRMAPSELVMDVVRMSDVVVTAMDSLGPRLNVQLAASAFGRPLVDVGVGVDDAVVWSWVPGGGNACIGCFLGDPRAYSGQAGIYASHPALASAVAGIAGWEVMSVALERSRGRIYRLRFDSVSGVSMSESVYEPEDSCPFHSGVVELGLDTGDLGGVRLSVDVKSLPWKSVGRLLEELESRLFKGRLALEAGGERLPSGVSLAWVSRMLRGDRGRARLVIESGG